jgi:hypothetical protein
MDKKIYSEKIVKPESVSFIIGKNGCHIKDITGKVKNGSYIEYKTEQHKFIVSAYSRDSLNELLYELNNLENEFELNRKKYGEYKFKNRLVDHALVTEVIQSMKIFSNSSFVEYKGDNLFILSNYKLELLQQMIEKIETFDKPVFNSSLLKNPCQSQYNFRRDFKKVFEEIERLEKENYSENYYNNNRNNQNLFIIMEDAQIEEQIDNYIEKSDSIEEIELDQDDNEYIIDLENDFVKNFNNFGNPFYQLSRDHPPNRRISDL